MTESMFPYRPFARSEFDHLGLNDWTVRAALAGGSLRRMLRGVYVRTDLEDSVELRAHALTTVLRPRQIFCDRTAAWLHGVDLLGETEHAVLPPLESCVRRGEDPTELAGVRARSRDLLPRDIVLVGGVPVTSPLRTALDLGCNLRRRDAIAALDQLRREHGISALDLGRELGRYRGRRGVVQLRELIPVSDPRSESVRESWVRLAIADDGLPAPVAQYWVVIDGVRVYRLDLAYPQHRVAVEYDGIEFHSDEERRHHDAVRRARLAEHGWTVIVVRRGDFTGDRLSGWLGALRQALLDRPTNLRW